MSRPAPSTRFQRLATATAAVTLTLAGVGGLVRATGSGLGCHDSWPDCAGGWIAPATYEGVIEYSHRLIAGLVVILLVATALAARRWMAADRGIRRWSAAAVVVVIAEAGLGGVVVKSELHAALVTAHLLLAMSLIAITTGIATASRVRDRPPAADRRVYRTTIGALAGTLLVLAAGAYVREKGAGLAFPDWPLMGGRAVPDLGSLQPAVHFVHRLLAGIVWLHVLALAIRTRREERRDVKAVALAAASAFTIQALVGAANVWTDLSPAPVMAHVAGGALTWALLVALAVLARRGRSPHADSMPVPATTSGFADRIVAYVRLTKPRIVVLLLVTTVPAMVLAHGGFPSIWLVGATLIGGILTSGSANAINQYLDRDIDEKMKRTQTRPLPAHSIEPRDALLFGLILGVAGTAWLTITVNALAATLALAAICFYVFVYTVWLKRTTPQNIVIGGAAGAAPVLIGWAAVTNSVGPPAWVMFGIVFLWTPPHFWALAMRFREEYATAGVPMLPVVRSDRQTTLQILLYTLALVPFTLLLSPIGRLGPLYAAAALVLGAWFVYRAVRLRAEPSPASAMRMFRYSVNYLGLLFAAIAVDGLVFK